MTRLLAIPLAAVLLAGCGSSGSSSTPSGSTPPAGTTAAPAQAAASSGPQTVTIAGYKFAPATLTVKAGTKVTWKNQDAAPHTASATGLDTGTLMQGQAKTLTLSKPGTYKYVCQFHPYMHGTVVVR